MLFNSASFILGFLPVAWIGFFALGTGGQHKLAVVWLTAASLFFYGWWNPTYLPLLVGSIIFNYLVGRLLTRSRSRALLVAGVAANLLLLGYYKYAGFLVQTVDGVSGAAYPIPDIALPLAISFFTFQQIAFLVDSFDAVAEEASFANYSMFITFFPHLIAGPITHHREMLPQFRDNRVFRPQMDLIALGLTLFLLGLCKKVLLADTVSGWASPMFAAAAAGKPPGLEQAWAGSISYTFQMYFDFSGYSDMAIGLGLLFGIHLPRNFNSPYKAHNIIDYWSRWHMTLTRFLTAYIYNPVTLRLTRARARAGKPGLKRGKTSLGAFLQLVAAPTLLTMFLAGLWHGAGWQFIVFGVLHGCYLAINHAWRTLKAHWGWQVDSSRTLHRLGGTVLTFLCVVVALVFFRSANVGAGLSILGGAIGLHGGTIPPRLHGVPAIGWMAQATNFRFAHTVVTHEQTWFLLLLFFITYALPNTQQWLRLFETSLGGEPKPSALAQRSRLLSRILVWRPTVAFGIIVGCVGFFSLMRAVSAAPSEFLYFKF